MQKRRKTPNLLWREINMVDFFDEFYAIMQKEVYSQQPTTELELYMVIKRLENVKNVANMMFINDNKKDPILEELEIAKQYHITQFYKH